MVRLKNSIKFCHYFELFTFTKVVARLSASVVKARRRFLSEKTVISLGLVR